MFEGHSNPVHSIVWEDCDVMEGSKSNVLVTADSQTIKVWDIETQEETRMIGVEGITNVGEEISVVKRDPHN